MQLTNEIALFEQVILQVVLSHTLCISPFLGPQQILQWSLHSRWSRLAGSGRKQSPTSGDPDRSHETGSTSPHRREACLHRCWNYIPESLSSFLVLVVPELKCLSKNHYCIIMHANIESRGRTARKEIVIYGHNALEAVEIGILLVIEGYSLHLYGILFVLPCILQNLDWRQRQ